MDEKRVIWVVIAGTALLTGWKAIRTKSDPIPQLAGIGATGVILLFMAEAAPKLASSFAVLFGVAYAYGYEPSGPIPDQYNVGTGKNFPRSGRNA